MQEIRTASATELVVFFHDPTFNGPVWGRTYTTNAVSISNPSAWTLNGMPVTALNEFVTESDGSDYHIYVQVAPADQWHGLHLGDAQWQHELCL